MRSIFIKDVFLFSCINTIIIVRTNSEEMLGDGKRLPSVENSTELQAKAKKSKENDYTISESQEYLENEATHDHIFFEKPVIIKTTSPKLNSNISHITTKMNVEPQNYMNLLKLMANRNNNLNRSFIIEESAYETLKENQEPYQPMERLVKINYEPEKLSRIDDIETVNDNESESTGELLDDVVFTRRMLPPLKNDIILEKPVKISERGQLSKKNVSTAHSIIQKHNDKQDTGEHFRNEDIFRRQTHAPLIISAKTKPFTDEQRVNFERTAHTNHPFVSHVDNKHSSDHEQSTPMPEYINTPDVGTKVIKRLSEATEHVIPTSISSPIPIPIPSPTTSPTFSSKHVEISSHEPKKISQQTSVPIATHFKTPSQKPMIPNDSSLSLSEPISTLIPTPSEIRSQNSKRMSEPRSTPIAAHLEIPTPGLPRRSQPISAPIARSLPLSTLFLWPLPRQQMQTIPLLPQYFHPNVFWYPRFSGITNTLLINHKYMTPFYNTRLVNYRG